MIIRIFYLSARRIFLFGESFSSYFFLLIIIFSIWLYNSSCKKMLEVGPPVTSTNGASVYTSDATAIAALTGIYSKMSANGSFAAGTNDISVLAGLSADELKLYSGVSSSSNLVGYYI